MLFILICNQSVFVILKEIDRLLKQMFSVSIYNIVNSYRHDSHIQNFTGVLNNI